MKAKAQFYLLNYDFSPEFAEAHHNGEQSENNRYYDWEDELVLTNSIIDVVVKRQDSYILEGTFSDDSSFSESVPDMFMLEMIGEDGSVTLLGCSESLMDSYEIIKENDAITLIVTMAENEPLSNPVPGIYVAASSFPKKLILASE